MSKLYLKHGIFLTMQEPKICAVESRRFRS